MYGSLRSKLLAILLRKIFNYIFTAMFSQQETKYKSTSNARRRLAELGACILSLFLMYSIVYVLYKQPKVLPPLDILQEVYPVSAPTVEMDTVLDLIPDLEEQENINYRPIIGVLSQELPPTRDHILPGASYIAVGYVKWIESAGARVVPIIINSNQNYTKIFHSINGLVIPGGATSPQHSEFARVARLFLEMAKVAAEAGDEFPVWGECLGFELMVFNTVVQRPVFNRCDTFDAALPLILEDWKESRMFGQADPGTLDVMQTKNISPHFHRWCLLKDDFHRLKLGEYWRPTASNIDRNGLEHYTALEARDYPFYALMFHPEKVSFEWTKKFESIPRSREAKMIARYFGDFLIELAMKNKHRFNSRSEEEFYLITPHQQVYTGSYKGVKWTYESVYIFENNLDIHAFNMNLNQKLSGQS